MTATGAISPTQKTQTFPKDLPSRPCAASGVSNHPSDNVDREKQREENQNDEISPFGQIRSMEGFQNVREADSKACSIPHPLLFRNPKVMTHIAGFELGPGSCMEGRRYGIEPSIAQPDSLHRPVSPPR
jgi:hypothetical protein